MDDEDDAEIDNHPGQVQQGQGAAAADELPQRFAFAQRIGIG
jgi:hypothetical protein